MEGEALQLTFDPMTIEHLGSNMYSRLPNAVAELVANSYDADATRIVVRVRGRGDNQYIAVDDDGHGMSRNDLAEKYLRIGRNRRQQHPDGLSESGKRHVSGKKGLGKLALFGIGSVVEVETKRAQAAVATRITLDWENLRSSGESVYRPQEEAFPADPAGHGTTVTIRNLERKTDVDAADLATSLSRLFNYADSALSVQVEGRDGTHHPVDAASRLSGIDAEFAWVVPESDVLNVDVLRGLCIEGRLVAARKPLPTQLRGVTVYANGRMVNEPEFFGASDSSYAYAYLTGYVEIDRLDEIKPDVIATDRRAVNWETPESAVLRDALRRMVEQAAQDRRRRRDEAKERAVSKRSGVDAETWHLTIHGPGAQGVKDVVDVVTSDEADMSDEVVEKVIEGLKKVAPPYADLFWRQLDPVVQAVTEDHYKAERYLEAVAEAYKGFIEFTRELTNVWDGDEAALLGRAYGRHADALLKIMSRFDTSAMSQQSVDSIEDGQRDLAKGVGAAFRNPLSHVPVARLQQIGLFSYQDCLDALSIISHLCRRARGAAEEPEGLAGFVA